MHEACAFAVVRSGHVTTNAPRQCSCMFYRSSGIFCHSDDSAAPDQDTASVHDAQVLLAVSVAALSGKSSFNAIQFRGKVQGHSASILIDSGSSHTFVSRSFAAKLSGQSPLSQPLTVKIADGQLIQCDSEILQLHWSVQGCDFQSDAKILSLAHFDVIVGMDWLARFSPM